jgi:hypothetical protein
MYGWDSNRSNSFNAYAKIGEDYDTQIILTQPKTAGGTPAPQKPELITQRARASLLKITSKALERENEAAEGFYAGTA